MTLSCDLIAATFPSYILPEGAQHRPRGRRFRRASLSGAVLGGSLCLVLFAGLSAEAQTMGTVVGFPAGPATPVNPQPIPNQFGAFTAPPYELDTVRGEIVNLETQLVAPILLTRDGEFLVAINEPDNRVVVMNPKTLEIKIEIPLGQGLAALAERPGLPDGHGEIWVSMRHQSAVVVIDTITWRPTTLLRPPVQQTAIGTRHASNPGGIAFNKSGTKAYVAAGNTDRLVIYDSVNKVHLKNLNLSRTHNGRVTSMNEPMAVIAAGNRIFVASHLSGNQALVDYRSGSFPQTLGFNNVFIEDLDDDLTFTRRLPDLDILEVDSASDSVVGHWSGVGTLLFGMAVDPTTDNLVVANMEARNGELIGEGAFPGGRVARNRVTWATPNQNPASYIITNTEDLGAGGTFDLVMPTAVVVDSSGTAYVAGYASGAIAAFSPTGGFLGVTRAQAGPRGLAINRTGEILYSLNRAQNSVSRYDVSGGMPPGPQLTRALHDPTFDRVKEGRKIFLSPKNSGDGTAGCFSCHPDARKDGAGWQISKYFDIGESFTEENPPTEWRDRKGVMVTQDLRSLPEVPAYHWRGEQKDLDDFNGAFVDLLKAPALMPAPDFALMKDYVFSTHYPPNPFQPLNRVYSASALAGFGGAPRTFNATCRGCHALPTGTDSSPTEGFLGNPGTPFADKTAQLRAMWTKFSSLANVQTNSNVPEELWPLTGFGLVHEGQLDDMPEFMARFFGGFNATEAANTIEFIAELDTGLAPFTHYSEFLNAGTAGSHRIKSYLVAQANAGNGDLIAHGRIFVSGAWNRLGLLWDVPSQTFLPSLSSLGPFTWPAIQALATVGHAELLFLGVPGWSGERLGVDRDRDGVFDGDEIAQGLRPINPDSDGDGLWDSYDPQPLVAGGALPVGAPQVVPGSIQVTIFGANGARVDYETDTFSPTHIEFGPTTAYGFTSGDPFPLGVLANNTSNLWKRRHVAFLRPQPAQGLQALDDGTLYHFRIHTQGQNGVTAVSADFDTVNPLLTDANALNFRIESIALSASRTGLQVDYDAVVRVVDNNGQPAPTGTTVIARYTLYTGTTIDSQAFPVTTTDANGFTTMSTSTTNQSAGDLAIFDIPMAQILSSTPFHWPEGAIADKILAP